MALAYGRPEPPSPYRYSAPAPSSGYGAPSSGYAAPSSGYGAPSLGGGSGALSFGGHSSSFSSGSFAQSGLSIGGGSGSFSGGNQGFSGGYAGGYAAAPLVQKHIYVHVPPPEQQELRAPRIPEVAPPQKHYKIIFIKAPTPPTPTAPIIPVQPQNEEKTLVYVLVKKPEEQPDIVIPTPAPTQPSKPEVYFIKYQTQKESSGADLSGATLSGATGGAEISGGDFSGAGAESGSDAGQLSSSQYGPPGHVAGPLH